MKEYSETQPQRNNSQSISSEPTLLLAGSRPPVPTIPRFANQEQVAVLRSAHGRDDGTFQTAASFVVNAEGARALTARIVTRRWTPGSPIPKRGEAEPDALGALARHAENFERCEREAARGRKAAA